MNRVIVLGCPGAGKSTFSRKLAAKTGLPLIYLDMIWHKPDRTVIGREEFDRRLSRIVTEDKWILDGNYARTLPLRLAYCDTVFLFELPMRECISGVRSRIGKKRVDMPWVEKTLDPDFFQWIKNFPEDVMPEISIHLRNCGKPVFRFHSRKEADAFIESLGMDR